MVVYRLIDDPVDRIFLATAAEYGCIIVSKDRRLGEYGVAKVIW